jgi:predicted small metal-binding protein
VKTKLICPCGVHIKGKDEDDLVEKAKAHLAEEHPGMEYSREEILAFAF